MFDYELFGKRIRVQRSARNLTREQLAERTDLSISFLGNIEKGKKAASLDTLYKLAVALECSADELLGLERHQKDLSFRDLLNEVVAHIEKMYRVN